MSKHRFITDRSTPNRKEFEREIRQRETMLNWGATTEYLVKRYKEKLIDNCHRQALIMDACLNNVKETCNTCDVIVKGGFCSDIR